MLPARPKAPKRATCRMFDTPIIERFSRIKPPVVFTFWVPVIVLLSWWVLRGGMWPLCFALLALAGWLAWTISEYGLHRYVFHWLGPGGFKRRFHFVVHGVHHDFPQDVERLVMPLTVSVPVGLLFYVVMDLALPRTVAVALFVGFGFGYLVYDGVHYFTHHLKARSRVAKFLKRYHMVHHHTGVDGLYGVSQPLWDYVFRTHVDRRERAGGGEAGAA